MLLLFCYSLNITWRENHDKIYLWLYYWSFRFDFLHPQDWNLKIIHNKIWRNLIMNERSILICLFQSHDSWNCIVRYVAITILNRLRTNKLFSHALRGNNSCKTHDFRIKVGTVQLVNSFKRKNVFRGFFFLILKFMKTF